MNSKIRRRPISEINVIPYIDVMLVLLVIFMIMASLLKQGVEVELPKAQAKDIVTENNMPIIVSVDSKGRYYLNIANQADKPITDKALQTRIAAELQIAKKKGQKRHVLVKGDEHVEYAKVVGAMVLLQHAGVENVGLLTKPAA